MRWGAVETSTNLGFTNSWRGKVFQVQSWMAKVYLEFIGRGHSFGLSGGRHSQFGLVISVHHLSHVWADLSCIKLSFRLVRRLSQLTMLSRLMWAARIDLLISRIDILLKDHLLLLLNLILDVTVLIVWCELLWLLLDIVNYRSVLPRCTHAPLHWFIATLAIHSLCFLKLFNFPFKQIFLIIRWLVILAAGLHRTTCSFWSVWFLLQKIFELLFI